MKQVDFSVFSSEGARVALVEAKARHGTSPEWARALRDAFLGNLAQPREAFLLATPDWFYIWKSATELHRDPDVTIEAKPLLGDYLRQANLSGVPLSPHAFERVVGWWLRDLVDRGGPTKNEQLNASGLPDAVHGGRVEAEHATT